MTASYNTIGPIINSKKKKLKRSIQRLQENDPRLKYLWLDGHGIGDEDAMALAGALETNSTLTSLSMGDNTIGSEGARALAYALEKNSTLTGLHLYRSYIGAEGARALAGALKTNSTLTYLDLHGNNILYFSNNIGDEGAIALAGALKTNSTLTTVDLKGTNIGSEGARALAGALETNSTLTYLNLYGNPIGTEGARALAGALEKNNTLTSLHLYPRDIGGEEGARALAGALEKNTTLTDIGWYISEDTRLNDAVERNKSLPKLALEWKDIQDEETKDLIRRMIRRNQGILKEMKALETKDIQDEVPKYLIRRMIRRNQGILKEMKALETSKAKRPLESTDEEGPHKKQFLDVEMNTGDSACEHEKPTLPSSGTTSSASWTFNDSSSVSEKASRQGQNSVKSGFELDPLLIDVPEDETLALSAMYNRSTLLPNKGISVLRDNDKVMVGAETNTAGDMDTTTSWTMESTTSKD